MYIYHFGQEWCSILLPGGRLGINLARMCVSKSEGYGSLFGFKRME